MRSFLLLACALSMAAIAPQSPPIPDDHEAIHKEMEALFQAIEVRQHGIDRMLFEASTGKTPAKPVEESGIGDLIRKSRDHSQDVQRDIARILELARSHTHKGGGECKGSCRGLCKSAGGKGKKPSSASSGSKPAPLAGVQRNGAPREREGTPSEPSAGTKPSSDGSVPTNPGPDDPEALSRDQRAGPPPIAKTEYVAKPDASERWGDLPIQVREVFRTQGGADMPPQYRDWIDGYYRRLIELK